MPPGQVEVAAASGNLTLTAGTGSLGSASAPLVIQAGGELASASAGTSLYLDQPSGTLTLGRIFAGGTASLQAGDTIELDTTTDLPVYAANVALQSSTGGIGTDSAPIPLELTAGGSVIANASLGVYLTTATAPSATTTIPTTVPLIIDSALSQVGDVWITNSGSPLDLVRVDARRGTATITSDASIQGSPASNRIAKVLADNINLTSGTGSIGAVTNPLVIRVFAGGLLDADAATGIDLTQVTGNLSVSRATTEEGDLIISLPASAGRTASSSRSFTLATGGTLPPRAGASISARGATSRLAREARSSPAWA